MSLPKDPEFDESARLNARPPAEPIGTDHTAIGTVKWWKDAKGFGAIACVETAPWDIWFHYSTIPKKGVATLPSGERVEALLQRRHQARLHLGVGLRPWHVHQVVASAPGREGLGV